MEKRYQVFISSTKRDLEKVRRETALALLEGQFIPVGMEQWGSLPIDSWSLIKKYIDQCDYYVVIIAGLYGSIHPEKGLSFTECEYDYAIEQGIPVLAFIHENPQKLPGEILEKTIKGQKRLEKFREKVKSRWNVEFWSKEDALPRLITNRLGKAVELAPRPGWVPGTSMPKHLEQEIETILKPCRSQGITKVVPNGKADSNTMESNLEVAREIKVITTSGTRFLDGYRRSISKALAKGATMRVLIPKPESDFVRDVGESEREGKGGEERREEIFQEIGEADRRLSEYLAEANRLGSKDKSQLGTVLIGYFTTHLRSTLILCDDKWGWLTITLPPLRASETLSFELSQVGSECILSDCIRHFDRTWDIIESRNDVTRL